MDARTDEHTDCLKKKMPSAFGGKGIKKNLQVLHITTKRNRTINS